jgi:hypothetical protein
MIRRATILIHKLSGGIFMVNDTFRKEIERLMCKAKESGYKYIDINSGEVHRNVGGYPSKNHRMANCCQVMQFMMKAGEEILSVPPKGKGATLTIRYYL